MKIAVSALAALIVLWLIAFAAMGWWSGRESSATVGMIGDRLGSCPASPNCVCSENADDDAHSVAPITGAADQAMIIEVAETAGGQLVSEAPGYVHFIFTSRIFRFVDDVEFRIDKDLTHVRSASRVGYSDLGVNQKRVEQLRQMIIDRRGS